MENLSVSCVMLPNGYPSNYILSPSLGMCGFETDWGQSLTEAGTPSVYPMSQDAMYAYNSMMVSQSPGAVDTVSSYLNQTGLPVNGAYMENKPYNYFPVHMSIPQYPCFYVQQPHSGEHPGAAHHQNGQVNMGHQMASGAPSPQVTPLQPQTSNENLSHKQMKQKQKQAAQAQASQQQAQQAQQAAQMQAQAAPAVHGKGSPTMQNQRPAGMAVSPSQHAGVSLRQQAQNYPYGFEGHMYYPMSYGVTSYPSPNGSYGYPHNMVQYIGGQPGLPYFDGEGASLEMMSIMNSQQMPAGKAYGVGKNRRNSLDKAGAMKEVN
ncbi:uncharacterized protein V1510DRAFT_418645 [Dipodascopsis tothii]|uniref:uncharacterized protein n=1 Tax=Dipodascopsis tothii TaxID=44089 RepID=UPI0034CD3E09